jgi:hypothetical protein
MEPPLQRVSDGLLTHKSLMLTLWARDDLSLSGGSKTLIPLTLTEFKRLFVKLFPDAGAKPPPRTRRIPSAVKESFLEWISEKSGLADYQISKKIGPTLEALFEEIESEYGALGLDDLDARYIYLFLIQNGSE